MSNKPQKKGDQNKPWNLRSKFDRKQATIPIKNTFFIICEGKNTEPEYFKAFPVTTETIVESLGVGRSKTSLVDFANKLVKENGYQEGGHNFDPDRQIWCVFDKDVKGENGEDEDYNRAIELARDAGFRVAYSNDAFELWLILHDQYWESAAHRKVYYEKLSERLDFNYEKKGKEIAFCTQLYAILESRKPIAIKLAKKLHQKMKHLPFHLQNPCTTVFLLVEELDKCLRK